MRNNKTLNFLFFALALNYSSLQVQAVDKLMDVLSDDNSLASITTSVGTVDSTFSSSVFSYTVEVPEGTTSITITAVKNDVKANINPNANGVFVVPFDGTDTTLVFTITSEAGMGQSYSVLIKKAILVCCSGIIP